MKTIVLSLSALFFLACTTTPQDRPDNKDFSQAVDKYLQELWDLNPGFAAHMGLSQYDDILKIPNKEARDKDVEFAKKEIAVFENFKDEDLSFSQRTDRDLILNSMKRDIWENETFRSFEWNPMMYNVGGAVSIVLESQKKDLDEKLKALSKKLLKVPQFYQVAKSTINRPTQPHTQLALKQSQGLQKYLSGEVRGLVKKSKLSSREKKTLYQRIDASAEAVRRYATFLKGILANPKSVGGFRDFRLGKELYEDKFKFDLQVSYSPEQLYKKALEAKEDTRSKMFELAIQLYPKYFGEKLPPKDRQKVIQNVIDKISKNHTKPDEFVETVRKQIPELTKFVKDKDLLTLDPKKPLKVRETPQYQRGFAGASVDSPGPFDKARETFYNVTPLENMTKAQKESYLREYNDYTLQILNIHEAIPGHYAQLVYSNKSPSVIKSIFGNGTMIEGWAVYTERMMLESGYGDNSPELWLMYYKWFLRVVTNTIIDYGIHNLGLTEKEAMDLMVNGAFQEKEEARKKWTRATVSQIQLCSYFAGFSEIYDLREQQKAKKGDDFNLKQFHETFLSFGSAPVRSIKKLMR
ncbi:MAG: DUF885 domain-containing protein [Bdellovibrionales bacterium]|nr:DUF885 domain-containing protein [Bdellovibrionales bacterium]